MKTLLDFDSPEYLVEPQPFKYKGQEFVVGLAKGGDIKRFHNVRMSKIVWKNGQMGGVKDAADLMPLLISMCVKDSEGRAIPPTLVESWDYPVQKKLFELSQKMNGIAAETDPVVVLLKKALDSDRCPVNKTAFLDFLEELSEEDSKYLEVKSLLTGSDEVAKN